VLYHIGGDGFGCYVFACIHAFVRKCRTLSSILNVLNAFLSVELQAAIAKVVEDSESSITVDDVNGSSTCPISLDPLTALDVRNVCALSTHMHSHPLTPWHVLS
jgi:hypothetical protein